MTQSREEAKRTPFDSQSLVVTVAVETAVGSLRIRSEKPG